MMNLIGGKTINSVIMRVCEPSITSRPGAARDCISRPVAAKFTHDRVSGQFGDSLYSPIILCGFKF